MLAKISLISLHRKARMQGTAGEHPMSFGSPMLRCKYKASEVALKFQPARPKEYSPLASSAEEGSCH